LHWITSGEEKSQKERSKCPPCTVRSQSGICILGSDPEIHAKQIQELFQAGATIVNIHSGEADQKKVIAFCGKEVLPRLKNQQNAA
jgi:hypothetical protein